ncbi:6795_t:CDS:2 [Entrophospora sp. SA101]|nr:6795_t:CDS:2 [Entrophospora sp. SA101]
MVGIKKRTQHLKNIAKISVQSRQEKQKIPEDNEIYDSANSDDFEEMISYFDEEFENNSESLFQLLINNMKNYKAKRPLTYHGNSTITQKRRKASTKENINKNGQTLDQFFILEKTSSKEMTQDNDSQSSETVNNELEIPEMDEQDIVSKFIAAATTAQLNQESTTTQPTQEFIFHWEDIIIKSVKHKAAEQNNDCDKINIAIIEAFTKADIPG